MEEAGTKRAGAPGASMRSSSLQKLGTMTMSNACRNSDRVDGVLQVRPGLALITEPRQALYAQADTDVPQVTHLSIAVAQDPPDE